MEKPWSLQADYPFHPGVHTVRLRRAPATLELELEAQLTGDQWRDRFDAASIEDLTRKTGSFKEFGVFCSMLESALMKSSPSVSLKLLNFADLETLCSRKGGVSIQPPTPTTSPLGAKRYLILVYSVEFDRINYPLPLPYVGGPDPAALRCRMQELWEELVQLRAGHNCERDTEIRHLRDQLQRVQEELQWERLRNQHRQQQQLTELVELKMSERRLQQRVKTLTAELAACKRGWTPASRTPASQRRSPSTPRPSPPQRLASRESSQGRPLSRSPSLPAGSHLPRFDPTAFVRARQQRQKEIEFKNQRRRAAFGSASPARSRGRSSSAESFRSRRSAVSSSSGAEEHPPRGRRATHTRGPLSALSCNSRGEVPCPPVASAAGKCHGKENCAEEPSAELADIDARLQALKRYMDQLDTRG